MMWLAFLQTTQAQVYNAPPFNYSAPEVCLTNLGAFVGSLVGMVFGGSLVDYTNIWLSKQNNGILEPEFRLWAMILPTLVNAVSLFCYGAPKNYGSHWFVSVGIGQFCLGFAMSSIAAIISTYIVDSYPKCASEALVIAIFFRNVIGMGFTFAI